MSLELLKLFAYYSQDEKLTLNKALASDFLSCENEDYLQLLEWMQRHKLGVLEVENSFPLLERIRPRVSHLSWMGNLALLEQPMLSIVGPRMPSHYASQILHKLFQTANNYQLVTISGWARGVDHLAHQLSLQHEIPTIVVLGWGIKRYREQRSRAFLQKVIDAGGLILSEFKLDLKPTTWTFPQRNRIVAGLGQMLFLPEAALRSGSMISVEYAYQMQRPVYSVPSSLFAEQSAGVFAAYQEKRLHFAFDFDQLLSQYFAPRYDSSWSEKNLAPSLELSSAEEQMLHHFSQSAVLNLEKLLDLNRGDYGETLQLLTALELYGLIYQSSPNQYQRI